MIITLVMRNDFAFMFYRLRRNLNITRESNVIDRTLVNNFILTTKEAVGKTRSDMEEKDQLLKVLNIIRRKTENKLGTIEQELESLKQ